MHKQLVLLHNAIAAYFSGNAIALENTLKQFNIKVCIGKESLKVIRNLISFFFYYI